jgi:cellulose synthase/poly-beta-1,6-N-acetylglucosamine synthase-like glycosyltransferase
LASIGKPIDYTLDDICDFFESHPDVPAINTVRAAKTTAITVNTEINWSNYTKTPLVTVYVTNHNYGKYIKQAIDSVLSQKFRHFEIIIIDDGSTDDSKNTIETYRNDRPKSNNSVPGKQRTECNLQYCTKALAWQVYHAS